MKIEQMKPIDWWMVAIANCLGTNDVNKGTWKERIEFGKKFVGEWSTGSMDIEGVLSEAKEEYIAYKTLHALKKMLAGKPTKFTMPLDASSSGPQLMGILTGCIETMKQTNAIHTGKCEDLYTNTYDWMEQELAKALIEFGQYTRKQLKYCIMPTNYNSSFASEALFGSDTPEYKCFHKSRDVLTPGCVELLTIFNAAWNPHSGEYGYTNIAGQKCLVQAVDKFFNKNTGRANCKKQLRIKEVYELQGSYTYQYTERGVPCGYYIPLAANLIQGTDAGIKSLVQKDCKVNRGFDILTVHDQFSAHPVNMTQLCMSYREQLAYMFKRNHLQDLLSDLKGELVPFTRKCDGVEGQADWIHNEILNSQYTIC